jgi:hypothetical protein
LAGEDVLARTDPDRPLLTADEMAAEAAEHGRWSAAKTRLVDRGCHWELLYMLGVLGFLGAMGGRATFPLTASPSSPRSGAGTGCSSFMKLLHEPYQPLVCYYSIVRVLRARFPVMVES